MKSNIFNGLEELVIHLKDEPKEEYKVEVGLRPSGLIHLGNMMTLSLASWLIHELGTHKSKLNVTVCDIDVQCPDGNTLITYNHLNDKYGCHNSFSDHNTEKIKDFVSLLSGELGIKYNFSNLSEVQREERYRKGIENLISNPELLREILGLSNLKGGKVPVFPVCPSCKTATNAFSEYDSEKKLIKAHCKECDKDGEYHLYDPEIEMPVHFLIDPIRDSLIAPYSDIHVFGGDYSEEHGQNKLKKIEKIKMFGEAVSQRKIHYLVGPMFYSEDGSKMSKSNLNGLSLMNLKEHFRGLSGSEWIKHIVRFSEYLVNNKVNHVDYSMVKNELLGGLFTQRK